MGEREREIFSDFMGLIVCSSTISDQISVPIYLIVDRYISIYDEREREVGWHSLTLREVSILRVEDDLQSVGMLGFRESFAALNEVERVPINPSG